MEEPTRPTISAADDLLVWEVFIHTIIHTRHVPAAMDLPKLKGPLPQDAGLKVLPGP